MFESILLLVLIKGQTKDICSFFFLNLWLFTNNHFLAIAVEKNMDLFITKYKHMALFPRRWEREKETDFTGQHKIYLYTQNCHQNAWHLDSRSSSPTNLRGFHTRSHLNYLYIYKGRLKGVKRPAAALSLSFFPLSFIIFEILPL